MPDAVPFIIRRVEPDDYAGLHAIYAQPKAIWGTLKLPYPSLASWSIAAAEFDASDFHLVACVDGEIVGHLALMTHPNKPRRRHVGQIGTAVRDDWHGRGAGSALMRAAVDLADRWLNLQRLELEVYIDNEPALRLYKKFGFTVEGTLLNYAYRDGQYVDVYTMARLRVA